MTIDILICTIDEGIGGVGDVLMPPIPFVHYVISVQYTTDSAPEIPAVLTERSDVTVTMLRGRGLSRNRNNALAHATGDVVVIADDDCRYSPRAIDTIHRTYAQRPETDIVCFAAETYDAKPLRFYPDAPMGYAEACWHGYSPASVEMTFRRTSIVDKALTFNERFGLGSRFPAGEEDVFIADALRSGLRVDFVPSVIVTTDGATTGQRFLHDARLQEAKGAVFRHRFGTCSALWRTFKEGAHHLIFNHVNPLPIWKGMLRGICNSR